MKKILPIFVLAVFLFGCETENYQTPPKMDSDAAISQKTLKTGETPETPEFCNPDVIYNFSTEVGLAGAKLSVNDDGTNLYVTFEAETDWYLIKTGLYVGDEAGIPATGGNPELLTYHSSSRTGQASVSYVIPIADLPECFVLAAAVKVVQYDAAGSWINKTYGYVTDVSYGANLWEAYGEYCKQDCEENDCYGEETAWSFGTTFESLTGTTRWGWYSVYTLGESNSYTIYAGQHYDIGDLNVSDDGVNLTVEYQTEGGALLGLAHLYVGTEDDFLNYTNKKGTPIPGHFPYKMESSPYTDNFTFTIALSEVLTENGTVIIAAHAESYLPCQD
jgi:hypothetical protein